MNLLSKSIAQISFLLLILSILLNGCKSTHFVPDDKFLLYKNELKFTQKQNTIDAEELASYLKQKPNKAMVLGQWRIYLTLYNVLHKRKDDTEDFINKKHGFFTRLRLKSIEALGEEPVVLDSIKLPGSVLQLKTYLRNKGYYESKINYKIKYIGKKKANVIYTVDLGIPYTVANIKLVSTDKNMHRFFNEDSLNLPLKKNALFDINELNNERLHLSNLYQNKGYFDFNEYFIRYQVDSTLGNHKVNVNVIIDNPVYRNSNSDSTTVSHHKRYRIRNIYVQTDFNPALPHLLPTDSLTIIGDVSRNKRKWTLDTTMITFIYRDTLKYKTTPIAKAIYFKQNKHYRLQQYQDTYHQLNNLGIFNYIKIDYNKIETDTNPKLDVIIKMNSKNRHSLSAEGQFTFREGFGGGGIVVYKTKNPFRGLEQLEFRVKVFAENIKNTATGNTIIGTDIGPQLSMRIPSLLFFPTLSKQLIRDAYPKTTISSYFNYQNRKEYERWVFGFSNTYEMSETQYKSHKLSIPDVSLSYLNKNSIILTQLEIKDPRLAHSFQDYFNAGLKYSFLYNEALKKGVTNPRTLHVNGNFTGVLGSLLNYTGIFQKDNSGAQMIGGIRYSKFVKIDADFKKYYQYGKERQLIFRSYAGFAIPFGKGDIAVPFDKLFFTGGANGIRGWKIRTLGPGSSLDSSAIDKLGEIKLELNAEYRFRINSMIKGALFTDAGNIWRLQDNDDKAVFHFNRAYKELAVAAGVGLRFDFTFLIARVDVGWPIKKPYLNEVYQFKLNEGEFNIGIGYPF